MVEIKSDGFLYLKEGFPAWRNRPSETTAFEDEAVCLAFGAIAIKDPMLDERKENKGSSFLKP